LKKEKYMTGFCRVRLPRLKELEGPNNKLRFKVPFSDQKNLTEGMRAVLEKAMNEPSILGRVGAAARQYALGALTWEAKAEQILSIYQTVRTRNGVLE
jgi:hypothetical protein